AAGDPRRPMVSKAERGRRPPPPTVRKAARESPALRLRPGETVTPPAPAPARSQRSRRTTQAATTVTGFSPFYRCSQHRRTRSERKVVTDRTLKAWYHASIA